MSMFSCSNIIIPTKRKISRTTTITSEADQLSQKNPSTLISPSETRVSDDFKNFLSNCSFPYLRQFTNQKECHVTRIRPNKYKKSEIKKEMNKKLNELKKAHNLKKLLEMKRKSEIRQLTSLKSKPYKILERSLDQNNKKNSKSEVSMVVPVVDLFDRNAL